MLLLIVPCSGACASVDVDNSNTLVEAAALNLEIPPRYEHWRDSIEEQLVIAHQEFVGMNRWLRSSDSNQVSTLVLCLDVLAATKLYGQLSLSGNPQVARSFAKQKLAVVPLPRNDGLLAARARPPITLMRSIRHEAAHLWSFNYPELRASPIWFQEGFAESLAGVRTDEWFQPQLWRTHLAKLNKLPTRSEKKLPNSLRELPAELMIEARAQMFQLVMAANKSLTPWEYVEDWQVNDLLAATGPPPPVDVLIMQRGREFDPPTAGAPMLLCAFPRQVVTAVLDQNWGGGMWESRLQLGRGSVCEGGILITGSGAKRVRVRLDSFGNGGSYLEPSHLTWSLPVAKQGLSHTRNGVMVACRIGSSQGAKLEVQVGNEIREYELEEGELEGPFVVEGWSTSGTLTLTSGSPISLSP